MEEDCLSNPHPSIYSLIWLHNVVWLTATKCARNSDTMCVFPCCFCGVGFYLIPDVSTTNPLTIISLPCRRFNVVPMSPCSGGSACRCNSYTGQLTLRPLCSTLPPVYNFERHHIVMWLIPTTGICNKRMRMTS